MLKNLLVVLLAGIVCSAAAAAEADRNLFSEGRVALDRVQSLRYGRYAKMASTADIRVVDLVAEPSRAESLRLNLLPGESYEAVRTRVEESADGYTWKGTVAGGGTAILVVRGSQITGWVWVTRDPGEDIIYSISPIGGRTHVVRRTNQDWFDSIQPGCRTGTAMRKEAPFATAPPAADPDAEEWTAAAGVEPQTFGRPSEPVATAQSSCVVNVLAVYTPAAQSAHGDIPALAHAAIAQTNSTYVNSEVTGLTMNLVGTMQVNYVETGTSTGNRLTDLIHLREFDGVIDDVHTTRANRGADIVVLLVNDLEATGAFGEAWEILATSPDAFAVVDWEAAVDNLTFAHEIGHLQGARHDVDPSTSPYEYGHGACRNWPYNYRTIMATGACGETRVPYWSNPNVKYKGRKTGDKDFRNNARVLRETACTMSALVGPGLMGWNWMWGNGGNDAMHWWTLNNNDRFTAGDFDADGADELMAVNPNGYAHLMEYAGGWTTSWANSGNGAIDWWQIGSNDTFVAGDLIPGNWRDELLAIHGAGGYAHVMTYNGSAWTTAWANNGSGSIHWWQLSGGDRYLIGDFVPGNGRDELLAIQPQTGYVHVMAWNGNGFTTLWTNTGNHFLQGWQLAIGDRYTAGDFLPGNGRDELLLVNPNGATSAARLLSFNGSAWTQLWSNGSSGGMQSWFIHFYDRYIPGDFAPATPGEQLLAINVSNGWSQMLSFSAAGWQTTWSNSGAGNVGLWFINTPDRYLSGNFAPGDLRDELLSIQSVNGWSQLHNRW